MQASEMAAIHLLRTQSSLLNPSKFNLFYHSINCLCLSNHHNRNPNFSRHFRPFHSLFPKSSPESPLINVDSVSDGSASLLKPQDMVSDTKPRVWSVFSSPRIEPTNSINSIVSDSKEAGEEEEDPKSSPESPLINVDGVSDGSASLLMPQDTVSDTKPRVWSVFSSPQIEPTNSINSIVSDSKEAEEEEEEEEEEEGGGGSRKSVFSSPQIEPTNSINSIVSDSKDAGEEEEEEEEEVVSRVNFQPNVANNFISSSPQIEPTNSINSIVSDSKEAGEKEEEEEEVVSQVNHRPNVANNFVSRRSTGKRKKGKSKVHWVCSNCGHSESQWWGTCKSCNKVGTLKRFSVENEASESVMKRSWLPEQMVAQNAPVRLTDVNRRINHFEWRIRLSGLFGLEVNRVLGSGVVPGSLILVGGDPGVGKSTLALKMAALLTESCDCGGAAPVVYISGEESVEQIGNRADRLSIDTEDLFLYSSTDVEDILEKVQALSPRAVVVDSIQTVYLKAVTGGPGGLMQVKECTSELLRFAKKTNIPVILIGHVNKSGEIAGPRVLEHIVDVVLYMEGEKNSSHRLLRSVKNRFGSTDELGVFELLESGLEAVSNPSEMFLSEEHAESDHLAGLAMAVVIDGSRTFLIEVQALCVVEPSACGLRNVNGVQLKRADMIVAILKKQAGLKIEDHSIFLNVTSGATLTEPSGDLAVAAAICSSFLEFPLPKNVAFIGEIGLSGELRMIPRIEKRVQTLAKLGYKKCVVPKLAVKALATVSTDIQIVGCKNLKEVIDNMFSKQD